MTNGTTLYERVGGEPAVKALVEAVYQRILGDPDLKPYFDNYSLDRILSMQRELFCEALGGPLKYTGKPLSVVHHKLGIRMVHFQRFVGYVMEALEKAGLNAEERSQALAALALEADDIVGRTNAAG